MPSVCCPWSSSACLIHLRIVPAEGLSSRASASGDRPVRCAIPTTSLRYSAVYRVRFSTIVRSSFPTNLKMSAKSGPFHFNEAPARWPGKRLRESASDEVGGARASMRPRLGGRGRGRAPTACRASPSSHLASMRPRLGGRGRDLPEPVRQRLALRASMRPRLGGRGRAVTASGASSTVTGFNEAPARWPGKRRLLRRIQLREPGASMRPRLGGRGRDVQARTGVGKDTVSLQ